MGVLWHRCETFVVRTECIQINSLHHESHGKQSIFSKAFFSEND